MTIKDAIRQLNGMAVTERDYEAVEMATDAMTLGKLEQLQSDLARVTAERDAAVEDMKCMADVVREEYCDETICGLCIYDCDMGITQSGDYANECPGFERNDCFKWRGAGKERTE